MANNGAFVCDINSPQTLIGRKRFEGGLETTSIEFEYGASLQDVVSENGEGGDCIALQSSTDILAPTFVGSFEGDGSRIQNISFENFCPHMRPSRNATTDDLVLVQQKSYPKGISKVSLKSFFSLVGGYNGSLFEFVSDGANLGNGARLFKGVTVDPRRVQLNFRTLTFSSNFVVYEHEDEVNINFSDDVNAKNLDVYGTFMAPRVDISEVENPANGMITYDTKTQRFYGFANGKWIALHRPT